MQQINKRNSLCELAGKKLAFACAVHIFGVIKRGIGIQETRFQVGGFQPVLPIYTLGWLIRRSLYGMARPFIGQLYVDIALSVRHKPVEMPKISIIPCFLFPSSSGSSDCLLGEVTRYHLRTGRALEVLRY